MAPTLDNLDLETLDSQPRRAVTKGVTRKTLKGRKDRAEAKVKKDVRAECVARDGGCRIVGFYWFEATGWKRDDGLSLEERGACEGEDQWCHMHARRRSQTRGLAPEVRHDTRFSFMACQRHHEAYDAHRLHITALTRKGADGPLKFRRGK